MKRSAFNTLTLRFAAPLLLFVALGSSALVGWMQLTELRESRSVFAALARTNADFIRSARLPATERTAESLSKLLGFEVLLWPRGKWDAWFAELQPQLPAAEAAAIAAAHAERLRVKARGGFEAIAVPITDATEMIFARPAEVRLSTVLKPQTLAVLGAFWLFSLALAAALARGVVRPLRQLAQRLPHIANDAEATLPGAERADEIGQLARAYLDTRAQLAEERARREQAERLAILGRMATGLAHEIHNPLSAIRMHAQLLDSTPAPQLGEAAREVAPVLIAESKRIEGLVNQWMFLARPAPPQIALAALDEIVREVVRAHAAAAQHAGVSIVEKVPAKFSARVDARRLAQAVGNVVVNAIQAMPRGGTLTITGEENDAVRLIFRDSGAGFSEQAIARHAELFFSEKEGGMGIGLNVSAEILKAHGGALEVANAPGGGAVVTLTLPKP